MDDTPETRSRPSGFLTALLLVAIFAFSIALYIKSSTQPPTSPEAGREFPPIEASEWINGPGLDEQELRNRVRVIDAWAFWCGPCRAATPALLHLYEKYKEQQVEFLGLTSEGEDPRAAQMSRKYIEYENIPWPNALGAGKTLDALGVASIPQFWVVDRQNRIVTNLRGWSPSLVEELERAIIHALSSPAEKESK